MATTGLPDDLRRLEDEARDHYRRANFARALELDRELLAAADRCAHRLARIVAHRFIGLCLYRLGRIDESQQALEAALAMARDAQEIEQTLLICNHLGATLRRAGRLDEAYRVFDEALGEATVPRYMLPRARLLANFGALHDELGQRAAADDCYSRYEELIELLQQEHRL